MHYSHIFTWLYIVVYLYYTFSACFYFYCIFLLFNLSNYFVIFNNIYFVKNLKLYL